MEKISDRKAKKVFRFLVELHSGLKVYSSANINKGKVYRLSLPTKWGRWPQQTIPGFYGKACVTKAEVQKIEALCAALQDKLSVYHTVKVDWHMGCCAYINVRVDNANFQPEAWGNIKGFN